MQVALSEIHNPNLRLIKLCFFIKGPLDLGGAVDVDDGEEF